MIEIDGSHGEGGGQMLRTAVALSAVTGKSVSFRNIRAGRPKPGLAPQHLAAILGVAQICDAKVEGAEIGSTVLTFMPGKVRGGERTVDVGTAGSITLVLQSCLLALCRTDEPFTLHIRGGTDVRHAPPVDHYSLVLLPLLRGMGFDVHLDVERRGFYPEGGGAVKVTGRGIGRLSPLALEEQGEFLWIEGVAFAQNLPEHIPSRIAMECKKLLVAHQPVKMTADVRTGDSTGAGVELAAIYANARLGASKMGERGLRSEAVAQMACKDLMEAMECATLDNYSADQILPYLAMADGPSTFKVRELTSHLATQMWLVPQFLPVRFESSGKCPATVVVQPNRT